MTSTKQTVKTKWFRKSFISYCLCHHQ